MRSLAAGPRGAESCGPGRFRLYYARPGRAGRERADGGLAERTIAPVLKTGVPSGTGGSNPSPSAILPMVLPTRGLGHSRRHLWRDKRLGGLDDSGWTVGGEESLRGTGLGMPFWTGEARGGPPYAKSRIVHVPGIARNCRPMEWGMGWSDRPPRAGGVGCRLRGGAGHAE